MLPGTAKNHFKQGYQHSAALGRGPNVFKQRMEPYPTSNTPIDLSLWHNVWNTGSVENGKLDSFCHPNPNPNPNPGNVRRQSSIVQRNFQCGNTGLCEVAVCQTKRNRTHPYTHAMNLQDYCKSRDSCLMTMTALVSESDNKQYGQQKIAKRPSSFQSTPNPLGPEISITNIAYGKGADSSDWKFHCRTFPIQVNNTFQIHPNDTQQSVQKSDGVHSNGQKGLPLRVNVSLCEQRGNSEVTINNQTENMSNRKTTLLQIPANTNVYRHDNVKQASHHGPHSIPKAHNKRTPCLQGQMLHRQQENGYHCTAANGSKPSNTEMVGNGGYVASVNTQNNVTRDRMNTATHREPNSCSGPFAKSAPHNHNQVNDVYYFQANNVSHSQGDNAPLRYEMNAITCCQANNVSHSHDQRDNASCCQVGTRKVSPNENKAFPSQMMRRWHSPGIDNSQSQAKNCSSHKMINDKQCRQANNASNHKKGMVSIYEAASTLHSQLISTPSSFHNPPKQAIHEKSLPVTANSASCYPAIVGALSTDHGCTQNLNSVRANISNIPPFHRECHHTGLVARDTGHHSASVARETSTPSALMARQTGRHSALVARQTGSHSAIVVRETGHHSTLVPRKTSHHSALMARETDNHNALVARETGHHSALVARETDHHSTLVSRETDHHSTVMSREADHRSPLVSRETGHYSTLVPREAFHHSALVCREAVHQSALGHRGADYHSAAVARETGQHNALVTRETGHQNALVTRGTGHQNALVARGTGQHNTLVTRETGHQNALVTRETGHQNALVARETGQHNALVTRETGHQNVLVTREKGHHSILGHRGTDYHSAAVARETSHHRAAVARETGHRRAAVARETGHHSAAVARETGDHSAAVARETGHHSAAVARETGHHSDAVARETGQHSAFVSDLGTISSTKTLSSKLVSPSSLAGSPSSTLTENAAVVASDPEVAHTDLYLNSNPQLTGQKGTPGQISGHLIEKSMDPFLEGVLDDIYREKNHSIQIVTKVSPDKFKDPMSWASFEKAANEVASSKLLSEFQNSQNSEASQWDSGRNGSKNSKGNIVQVKQFRKNQTPICQGVLSKELPLNDILISDNELYKCGLCDGVVFDSPCSLMGHCIVMHEDNETLPCPHCHTKLEKYRFVRHIELRHRNSEGPRFFCGGMTSGQWKCFDSFDSLYTLWVHINSNHAGQKSIHCEQCEKTFETNRSYVLHYRSVLTVMGEQQTSPPSGGSRLSSDMTMNCESGNRIARKENKTINKCCGQESAISNKRDNHKQDQGSENYNFTAKPNNDKQGFENETPTSEKRNNNNQNCEREKNKISDKDKNDTCNAEFDIEFDISDKLNKMNQDCGNESTIPEKQNQTKVSHPYPSFQGCESGENGSLHTDNGTETTPRAGQTTDSMDVPRKRKRMDEVMIKVVPRMDRSVDTITATPFLGMMDALDDLLLMGRRKRKLQYGDPDPDDYKKIKMGVPKEICKQQISRCLPSSRQKWILERKSNTKFVARTAWPPTMQFKSESWADFLWRNKDVFDDEGTEKYSDVEAISNFDHCSEEDTRPKLNDVVDAGDQSYGQHTLPSAKEATPVHLDDLDYRCCFCSLTYNSIVLFRLHLTCHTTSTTSLATVGFTSRHQRCGLCDARLDLESSETLVKKSSCHKTHSSGIKNSSLSTTSNFGPYSSNKKDKFDDPISDECPRKAQPSHKSNTHYHCNGIKSQGSFSRSLHFYGGMMVSLYPNVQMCHNNLLVCTQ